MSDDGAPTMVRQVLGHRDARDAIAFLLFGTHRGERA
jgi:hypothetical protein